MKQRYRKRMEAALRLDTTIADARGAEERMPQIIERIVGSFCPGRFFKDGPTAADSSVCDIPYCENCWNGCGDEE